jgi:hypothetical protein
VPLTEAEHDAYYNGMSNSVLVADPALSGLIWRGSTRGILQGYRSVNSALCRSGQRTDPG